MKSLRLRMGATAVVHDDGRPALVHHATLSTFPVEDIAPFTHFGTRAAARARIGGWHGEPHPDARVVSAYLDIRSPLWLDDINNTHDVGRVLNLIAFSSADAVFDKAARQAVLDHEQETGEGFEKVVEILQAAGHDGIAYRNRHEDPGSTSWIIFRPDQVVPVFDGLLSDVRDPWTLTHDEWMGPKIVMDFFAIDGRSEAYEPLFSDLVEEADALPMIERCDGGWEARWLSDWEPAGTVGLFDPEGVPRGFYMSGQVWIDPEARGAGRSAALILAAAELRGGSPTGNVEGLGFSPAGEAAHLSAHRACVARAISEGFFLEESFDIRVE